MAEPITRDELRELQGPIKDRSRDDPGGDGSLACSGDMLWRGTLAVSLERS